MHIYEVVVNQTTDDDIPVVQQLERHLVSSAIKAIGTLIRIMTLGQYRNLYWPLLSYKCRQNLLRNGRLDVHSYNKDDDNKFYSVLVRRVEVA